MVTEQASQQAGAVLHVVASTKDDKSPSSACFVCTDLEESQDVWVDQAVLIAAQHVHHLPEALLTDAELPQTEGYVPPLLAVLLMVKHTYQVTPHAV